MGFSIILLSKNKKTPTSHPYIPNHSIYQSSSTAKPLAPFLLEGSSPFEMDRYLESYSPRNDPATAVES
jgi:hypothetical protein